MDIVKYLVSLGANPSLPNWETDYMSEEEDERYDAITMAGRFGHIDILKYYIELGCSFDMDDLFTESCKGSSVEMIKYILSLQSEEKNREMVVDYDNLAIKWASIEDKLEFVKIFLRYGADFNRLTSKDKEYFRSLRCFRRWRMVIFRRFFRKTVIPLYYSPGFPGGDRVKSELKALVGT